MPSCEDLLYKFLRMQVEPTPKQRTSAARSQNSLRNVLCDHTFGNRVLDTYLSGSYARDTAVQPLDDVDVVVIVNPDAWESDWFSARPDPEKVLASFAGAIRRRYPQSSVHMQNRSIGLKLYQLDIDVIPAIDAGRDLLYIPGQIQARMDQVCPKTAQ